MKRRKPGFNLKRYQSNPLKYTKRGNLRKRLPRGVVAHAAKLARRAEHRVGSGPGRVQALVATTHSNIEVIRKAEAAVLDAINGTVTNAKEQAKEWIEDVVTFTRHSVHSYITPRGSLTVVWDPVE